MQPSQEDFRSAIEGSYGCTARFIGTVPVKERFEGGVTMEASVFVFELGRHSIAERAYGWVIPEPENNRQRVFTILAKFPNLRDDFEAEMMSAYRLRPVIEYEEPGSN